MTWRVLSTKQPWASLWALPDEKDNETRDWATGYRGPLLIHASKAFDKSDREWMMNNPVVMEAFARHGITSWDQLPLGAIIGQCDLLDCVPTHDCGFDEETERRLYVNPKEAEFGNYGPNRFAWRTANHRLIEPIPLKGALGLWPYSGPVTYIDKPSMACSTYANAKAGRSA